MENNKLLLLISCLLNGEYISEDCNYVRKQEYDFFSEQYYEYRYYAENERDVIRIEKVDETNEKPRFISFRKFIWNCLCLDSIQHKYKTRYEKWKEWNQGVDYVPVSITCDGNEIAEPKQSNDFFNSFCLQDDSDSYDGLSLVMAEYGMGKSSFCLNLCNVAAADTWGKDKNRTLKDAFCGDKTDKISTAFPLLFDLNTYKNGDFVEYIENRLHNDYNINITYYTLIDLCQEGYFCIVLDAWDQMQHTPYASQVMLFLDSIQKLCDKKGRVLITCRRSFYQKYLKIKSISSQPVTSSIIQEASLFSLGGFSKESTEKYLKQALKNSSNAKTITKSWITECWKYNSDFLEKPFNIRLLASNFETVKKCMDLTNIHVRTYDFLEVILEHWRKENSVPPIKGGDVDPLKELVFQTLSLGLNRGITVEHFKSKLPDENRAEEYISALRKLEFVEIREGTGANPSIIEFRLAAFQEFLWARYVLEELKEKRLLSRNALINAYMLQLEVRSWITEELKELADKENDLLKVQLTGDGKEFLGLKYKDKAEIGYCASNVLTLYRDLNKIDQYHKQFLELQKDLRHYCFEEADLRGLNLKGAQFEYSDLLRVDLSYSYLENASFRAADLSEVIWDEFGRILKCAFIENFSPDTKTGDILSIAAGTESGSVLTYSINTEDVNITNLEDSSINAIAADATGVYTASQNGWVGYVDAKSGELKNAYISTNGLESITTVGQASIYVGAEANGLFRYNWKTGVKHAIEIDGNVSDISTVNYNKIGEENYIACISGYNRKELLLLKLNGKTKAKVVAKGRLESAGFYFDDICFAGKELAFAVSGKGLYSISIDELLDMNVLDDIDLCNEKNCRFKYRGKAVLAWAEYARMLFVLEKTWDNLETITGIYWDEGYEDKRFELEWNYKNTNYTMLASNVDFSVSANANYLAISGDRLAVFELEEDYYQLIKEPVEARINVHGADFMFCKGLPSEQAKEFKKRGASVSE